VESFTISPSLPDGLQLDPHTGVLAGTPTQLSPRQPYTITASNSHGSVRLRARLEVVRAPRFGYTVSSADSSILLFDVDPASGRLSRKGVQFAAPGEREPERIYVHPSGRFLYVPNASTDNISVYAVNAADGWLTPRAPAPAGSGPHRMALRPDGRFAYVASRWSNDVVVHAIDASTGALVPSGEALTVGLHPADLATDPDGRFLFVALSGDDEGGIGGGVQAFRIDQDSGALSEADDPIPLDGSFPSELRVAACATWCS
jgi:6-phosphogluconolactonase (cycloisomerase 2 family)